MKILVYIQRRMSSFLVSFVLASLRPLHWIKLMSIYCCVSPRVSSLRKLKFQLIFCYFLVKAFAWHLQEFFVLPLLNEHWFGCHQQNLQRYKVCRYHLKQPRHFHSNDSATRSTFNHPKNAEKIRSHLNLCRYLSFMRLGGNNGEIQRNQLRKWLISVFFSFPLQKLQKALHKK